MAVGRSQSIRCIVFEMIGGRLEKGGQHSRYLLFGCIAVTRYRLFDFFGEVFKNRDVSL